MMNFALKSLVSKAIMALLFLWSFPSFGDQCNLAIFLDQNQENIAGRNLANTAEFLGCLRAANCFAMVSKSIWRNCVERADEFALRSRVSQTREAKIVKHHNGILDRLTYWTETLKKYSKNPSEIRNGSLEQVREEFYDPEYIKMQEKAGEIFPITWQEELNFIIYLTLKNNLSSWKIMDVDPNFYVFVPINYSGQNELEIGDALFKKLGIHLRMDQLIEDPMNPSHFFFSSYQRNEGDFIALFKSVFKPVRDVTWNIYLMGHGANFRLHYQDRYRLIADLSMSEYLLFLDYLNTTMNTRCFICQTCYGAGKNLSDIFDEEMHASNYQFPIIISNLTDVSSYSEGLECTDISLLDNGFLQGFIFDRKEQRWMFKYKMGRNYKKFFKKIREFDFQAGERTIGALEDVFGHLMGNIVQNIIQLRMPKEPDFQCLYPRDVLHINDQWLCMKKLTESPVVVSDEVNFVLLATECIPMNIQVITKEDARTMPMFISTVPGKAYHILESLECLNHIPDRIIRLFRPLDSVVYDKIFFIKSLVGKSDPDSPLNAVIPVADGNFKVCDVIIRIESTGLMRISFKTKDGIYYGAHACQTQAEPEYTLRILFKLNEQAIEDHEQMIKKCTHECHAHDLKALPLYIGLQELGKEN